MNKSGSILIGGIVGLALLIVLGLFSSYSEEKLTDTGLRVAFIGDQGAGPSAFAVLNLIKDEKLGNLFSEISPYCFSSR